MSIKNGYQRDRYDAALVFFSGDDITDTTPSGTVAATTGEGATINVYVSAVDGTDPTLDLAVHASTDNFVSSNVKLGSLPQITETGITTFTLPASSYTHYKLVPAVGGTETPTFTVSSYLAY